MSAYLTICCDVETDNGQCTTEDSPIGAPQYATEARRHRTRDGCDLCPTHANHAPKESSR